MLLIYDNYLAALGYEQKRNTTGIIESFVPLEPIDCIMEAHLIPLR
jgi:hypothetical protein